MSDAYYSQLSVRFTGSSSFTCEQTSALFRSVVFVARRFFTTQGEIYDDGQVREFLMWLLKPSTAELYKHFYQFRAVHWYAVNIAKPIYNSSDSVNPLKSLLYAAFHHHLHQRTACHRRSGTPRCKSQPMPCAVSRYRRHCRCNRCPTCCRRYRWSILPLPRFAR